MKPINFLILTLLLPLGFMSSCESSKSAQNISKNMVEKISLEKVAMGGNFSLEITNDETIISEMIRGGASDAAKGETAQKSWNEINNLISKLNLAQIDKWEGPTQARFYDGARATTIIIEANGKTYNSQSFDEGEPPAELKKLYDYLESLVNQ